jgi:hypothetical protein
MLSYLHYIFYRDRLYLLSRRQMNIIIALIILRVLIKISIYIEDTEMIILYWKDL